MSIEITKFFRKRVYSGLGAIYLTLAALSLAVIPGAALAIVADEPDVSLEMTASSPTKNAGDLVTYTINVTQLEADDLTDITLTDVLPAKAKLVSVNATAGTACHTGPSAVVCDIPLAFGSPSTISIVVRSVIAGQLVNQATLTGVDVDDPDPIHLTTQIVTSADVFSSASLGLNGFFFNTGDSIHVNGKLTTYGIDGTIVDVWLLLLDPNGKISYLTYGGGSSTTAIPMVSGWSARNWPIADGSVGTIYDAIFSGDEPPGAYKIVGYLTEAGTATRISNQVSASFIFTP